ncbi:ClpXP protease specificity-enhancing factor [Veronia nyctiphanis]|uniref:ClpXP protease specificity-enhancing factor n=1 Tax=Veronia nyctiphanis TaxID=1278244 RepID=A0A4Q0YMD9_9GAMM|nr:ClpXP protease specificity-enhancing factor [Veronia nyctiphanis]RXJ71906.1 ClpXP protease specificity-enhancing factor [Veronia nyctiphanis]
MQDISLTPRRPYMLRAFYDWILDNDLTPHLVVNAELPGVVVPWEYVQDGQIVLNIAPRAVGELALGNEDVIFNARFGGRPMQVSVPLYAVKAIYARENGAGTMFEAEEAYEEQLEAVMAESEEQSPTEETPVNSVDIVEPEEALVDTDELNTSDVDENDEKERPKGKPTLTVVK